MQNNPVVKLRVNGMEVTEVYQSSSTDFEEISTAAGLEESTTEKVVVNIFSDPLLEFESHLRFSTIDYVVFAIMLAMSGETQFVTPWTISLQSLNFSSHRNLLWLHFKKETE